MAVYDWTPDPNWRHPADMMDDGEEPPEDPRAVALRKMFEIVFPVTSRENIVERMNQSWHRFIALTIIVKPQLLDGMSMTFLAKLAEVSPQCLSKLAGEIGDTLGFRGPMQENQASRDAHRQAQLTRDRSGDKPAPSAVEKHDIATRKAVASAKSKFLNNRRVELAAKHKAWSRWEKLSLWERGLLDNPEGELNELGQRYMAGEIRRLPDITVKDANP